MTPVTPSYGKPNFEMLKTWIRRPADQDGPFWALNLMKYREVAAYEDDSHRAISGKAADDAYAPLGPLTAIGAMVVLHADIARQALGEPTWDRIGIVRYPSRAAFFAMQERDDFKDKHVHKEAGMEFTIVMSCLPDRSLPPVKTIPGPMVLRVGRVEAGAGAGADLPAPDGAVRLATFDVEGVIVGDDRTWTRVAFDVAETDAALEALLSDTTDTAELFAILLEAPMIEALAESIDAVA